MNVIKTGGFIQYDAVCFKIKQVFQQRRETLMFDRFVRAKSAWAWVAVRLRNTAVLCADDRDTSEAGRR